MPFPLSTFEAHISADIANKGLNYFALGYVENLAEDRNTWAADVQGTHPYTVEIEVTGGEVNDWSCDCPYDWGPVCKHVAAVMYAILEETLKEVAAPKTGSSEETGKVVSLKDSKRQETDPIEEIISKLDQDEMRHLLSYFAKRGDDVRTYLLTKYSKLLSVSTRPQIKKMVKSIVDSHGGRRNFIEYRNASQLGVQMYYLLGENDSSNSMATVDLCEEVIVQLAKAVQHADDSSGSIGDAISLAFEMLADLTDEQNNTPTEVVNYIFKMALKEGKKKVYEDYGIDGFFPLAISATRSSSQADQLVAAIDAQILEREKETYGKYSIPRLAHMKYEVIEKWRSPQEAETYLMNHLHYASFRESAMEKAMVEKRYEDVRRLANEGITYSEQNNAPGHVKKWKEWLIRLAETTGDSATLIDLNEKLFLERGDMEYFRKLKQIIPTYEFSKKVDHYIDYFNRDDPRFKNLGPYFNQTVANILEAENRLSELMDLLKGAPGLWLLDRYYNILAEGNQASFLFLYSQQVREKMTYSSNRKEYRDCCRYLKKIIQLGGKEEAKLIAAEWRGSYPRRKAMDDELRKAGL